MNYRATCFVSALVLGWTSLCHGQNAPPQAPGISDVLYAVSRQQIWLRSENLRIKKTAGKLRFRSITEMGTAPDIEIQIRFSSDDLLITSTVTVYKAPEGTVGPRVICDADGKPKPADSDDNPFAVYELSEPSKSYTDEFNKVVKIIEKHFGLKLANKNNVRIALVPEDLKNSPVAYLAHFEGSGEFKDPALKEIPWNWDFYLYVIGKHFVKVHTDGPAGLDMMATTTEIVSAIKWLPKQ